MNVKLFVLADSQPSARRNYDFVRYMSDIALFRKLGLSALRSLEISGYEGADENFDLNSEDVPTHLEGAFDVVIDGMFYPTLFMIITVLIDLRLILLRYLNTPRGIGLNHG